MHQRIAIKLLILFGLTLQVKAQNLAGIILEMCSPPRRATKRYLCDAAPGGMTRNSPYTSDEVYRFWSQRRPLRCPLLHEF